MLRKNLAVLKAVCDRTGCKILLAQKAFSMFYAYPLIGEYLDGTTASGLFEARLGREEMGKETHIFSPAYREDEFDEIVRLCDHVVFNSFAQKARFGDRARPRAVKSACASTPPAPRRTMLFTIPVRRDRGWGSLENSFWRTSSTG